MARRDHGHDHGTAGQAWPERIDAERQAWQGRPAGDQLDRTRQAWHGMARCSSERPARRGMAPTGAAGTAGMVWVGARGAHGWHGAPPHDRARSVGLAGTAAKTRRGLEGQARMGVDPVMGHGWHGAPRSGMERQVRRGETRCGMAGVACQRLTRRRPVRPARRVRCRFEPQAAS